MASLKEFSTGGDSLLSWLFSRDCSRIGLATILSWGTFNSLEMILFTWTLLLFSWTAMLLSRWLFVFIENGILFILSLMDVSVFKFVFFSRLGLQLMESEMIGSLLRMSFISMVA